MVFKDEDYSEISKYLSFDESELSALESSECYIRAAEFTRYALFIKMEHNRKTAVLRWAESEIAKIASTQWSNYSEEYCSADIKYNMIAKENPKMATLLKIKAHSISMLADIDGVHHTLNKYADILTNIGKTKQWSK